MNKLEDIPTLKIALDTLMFQYSFYGSETPPLTIKVAEDILSFVKKNKIERIYHDGHSKPSELIILSHLQDLIAPDEYTVFHTFTNPRYSLVDVGEVDDEFYEDPFFPSYATVIDNRIHNYVKFGVDVLVNESNPKFYIHNGAESSFKNSLFTINYDSCEEDNETMLDWIKNNSDILKGIIIFDYEEKLLNHTLYKHLMKNNYSCNLVQYFLENNGNILKDDKNNEIKVCNIFYCVNAKYRL